LEIEMGFFSYVYVINGTESKDCITLSITAFKAEDKAFVSWGTGTRSPGLIPVLETDETLFCDKQLEKLPGYPRLDNRPATGGVSLNELYIEESFLTGNKEPVLFHVILPPRFVIRPNLTPFTLDSKANVAVKDDRLFFTWPTVGGDNLRFWIARLRETESLDHFDLYRLAVPPGNGTPKIGFELNLGLVTLTFG
jgi:hypothetical protein